MQPPHPQPTAEDASTQALASSMEAIEPTGAPNVHRFNAEALESTGGPAWLTWRHTQASDCRIGRIPVAAVNSTTKDLTWDTRSSEREMDRDRERRCW